MLKLGEVYIVKMNPTPREKWIFKMVSEKSGPLVALEAVKEITESSVEEKIQHVHGHPKTWGWVKKVLKQVEKVHVTGVGLNLAKSKFANVFSGSMKVEKDGRVIGGGVAFSNRTSKTHWLFRMRHCYHCLF